MPTSLFDYQVEWHRSACILFSDLESEESDGHIPVRARVVPPREGAAALAGGSPGAPLLRAAAVTVC